MVIPLETLVFEYIRMVSDEELMRMVQIVENEMERRVKEIGVQ
jgi:hypothetical protein